MADVDLASLKTLPLDALHKELGGRMVPFAGYAMPVQYPSGVMAEHLWTRDSAGLFDVSHMGQLLLEGDGAADWLERIAPGDFRGLPPMLFQVGSNEMLLDDSTRAAAKAHASGVDVQVEVFDGMPHVFQGIPQLPESKIADKYVAAFLEAKAGWGQG